MLTTSSVIPSFRKPERRTVKNIYDNLDDKVKVPLNAIIFFSLFAFLLIAFVSYAILIFGIAYTLECYFGQAIGSFILVFIPFMYSRIFL